MKNWVRYLLGAVAFFIAYITVDYLFDQKIDYVLAIVSDVAYTVFCIIFEKKKK